MTEKRFTFNSDSDWWTISDTTTNDERLWGQDVVDLLNELHEEKEKWKCNCIENESENSILWNEVLKLQEQGALPSYAFKNYLDNLKKKKKLKVVLHG